MDIIKPINKRLSRRKTPYSKRKIVKMVKSKTNKKKSTRKRNKR